MTAWRDPSVARLKDALVELAPIWWVARAYVVVAVLTALTSFDQGDSRPEVFRLVARDSGLALLALAVAASVALGLWQRRHARAARLHLALNLALAAAAVPVYADLLDWASNRQYAVSAPVVQPVTTPGLARDGVAVGNVYPYSRDGRLLLDVLLYDQNGAPLDVRPGDSDPLRRLLQTRDGSRIYNSFPIRYFDDGTRRVARPGAAPRIRWSPIVTPPLKPRPSRSRGSR